MSNARSTVKCDILAYYQIFGDVEAKTWGTEVLEKAKADGLIESYTVIHTRPGMIQHLHFEVIANLEEQNTVEALYNAATDLINKIVHDTDAQVEDVTIIA